MGEGAESGEPSREPPTTTRPSAIRPTDAASISLARRLARGARFGALSVLDPQTGHPFVSRVLIGTDVDGVPVMLASTLATHTKAVLDDPRCALLLGEPGRGDPMAWPRISVLCDAEPIKHDTESDQRIRSRFIRRHPKAKLYASFGDFSFYRLVPKSASLNGGFGRAYIISGGNLIIDSPFNQELCSQELLFLDRLGKVGCNGADLIAQGYFHEKTENWYISAVDADGIDIARRERLYRVEFVNRVTDSIGLIA